MHPRWFSCFEDVCVPGFPLTAPLHIGDPDIAVVEFAPSEWSFIATFVPADGKCQRAQRVGLDPSTTPRGRPTRSPEERQSALPKWHFVSPTLSIRGQRSFCVDLGSQGPQGHSMKT
jgi:hypothetical protein